MARTYIISEICGDWALQIREPGHPHQFLYFNSENNADLVKSILEWEDAHPNEAVPYKPTLTPPNEPLTLEQIKSLYDSPAWYQDLYRKMGYWVIVGAIGEIGVHLTDLDNANEFYSTIDYGARWALFRRPPEGEKDA